MGCGFRRKSGSTGIHADFVEGDTVFPENLQGKSGQGSAEPEKAFFPARRGGGAHPGETGGRASLVGGGQEKIRAGRPSAEAVGNFQTAGNRICREVVPEVSFERIAVGLERK